MKNVLKEKSFQFALKVVEVYKQIIAEHKEYGLTKQFLKAGTATGALIREAEFAQSKADFISKLSIALKEANETQYWIDLLEAGKYITLETKSKLENEINEILPLLISSIKTAKSNLMKNE